MKITSGEYAGIPLFTPKNYDVRPTLAKTRQAVFNMLRAKLTDSVCVDLFSGTGAFGYEALSNAAKRTVFIDIENRGLLLKNAEKLKIAADKYEVMTCDFEAGLLKLAKQGLKADIVFADPPYNKGFIIKLLKSKPLNDILNREAMFVIEAHVDEMKEIKDVLESWNIYKEKKYGDTVMLLINREV